MEQHHSRFYPQTIRTGGTKDNHEVLGGKWRRDHIHSNRNKEVELKIIGKGEEVGEEVLFPRSIELFLL